MCAKCVEIDKRIEHFKKLHERLLEAQTLRSIEILIEELEAKKASLHPEGNEYGDYGFLVSQVT